MLTSPRHARYEAADDGRQSGLNQGPQGSLANIQNGGTCIRTYYSASRLRQSGTSITGERGSRGNGGTLPVLGNLRMPGCTA
jgi:hypothetical protein